MKRVFISVLVGIILAPIMAKITVISEGPFGEMAKAEGKLLLASENAPEKGEDLDEKASEEGEDSEERDPKI